MRVQVRLTDGSTDPLIAEGVHHIHMRGNGALVLRFADHKKTIVDDEYSSFTVSGD